MFSQNNKSNCHSIPNRSTHFLRIIMFYVTETNPLLFYRYVYKHWCLTFNSSERNKNLWIKYILPHFQIIFQLLIPVPTRYRINTEYQLQKKYLFLIVSCLLTSRSLDKLLLHVTLHLVSSSAEAIQQVSKFSVPVPIPRNPPAHPWKAGRSRSARSMHAPATHAVHRQEAGAPYWAPSVCAAGLWLPSPPQDFWDGNFVVQCRELLQASMSDFANHLGGREYAVPPQQLILSTHLNRWFLFNSPITEWQLSYFSRFLIS